MNKLIVGSIMTGALVLGSAIGADARPLPSDWHLHPCGSPTLASPTGEVERALRTSATEFGVSYSLLRSIARGESAFDPKSHNRVAGGLFQHLFRYYPSRVTAFNKAVPNNKVSGYIYDIWGNTRVSARMIQTGGTGPWRCR